MNLGNRLKTAFELAGMRTPAVAKASGVPATSINALLRRGSDRSAFTEQILAVLPKRLVNHDWVRTGQGTPQPTDAVSPPIEAAKEVSGQPSHIANHVQNALPVGTAPISTWLYPVELPPGDKLNIPRLGVMPYVDGAGNEIIKTMLLTEELAEFDAHSIREDHIPPATLAWSRASETSAASSIYKGDRYAIDTSITSITDVIDGKTYSVMLDGKERPRKLHLLPNGGIQIAANDPSFKAIDLTGEAAKGLRIIGRVVQRAGRGDL